MCRVLLMILHSLFAQAHAEDLARSRKPHTQDSLDTFVDKLADKLVASIMLGRTAHLQIPRGIPSVSRTYYGLQGQRHNDNGLWNSRMTAAEGSSRITRAAAVGQQMLVFVPPHPLIQHWVGLLRNKMNPGPVIRSGVGEVGRLLIYEAVRDLLPTIEGSVQSPDGYTADATMVDPSQPLKVISTLRSGTLLTEQAAQVLPFQEAYQVGVTMEGETPKFYFDGLPKTFSATDRILITELTLASGGMIKFIIDELISRGADISNIRIVSVLSSSPALELLSNNYKGAKVYTGMIDEKLDDKGDIVPGLGDLVTRAYGIGFDVETMMGKPE